MHFLLFNIINRAAIVPSSGKNQVYLKIDRWNDYSFVTMFYASVFDENGKFHELGNVKIGFVGQTKEEETHSKLEPQFENLSDIYFSLGTDTGYYKKLGNEMSRDFAEQYLNALNDIVHDSRNLERASGQNVLKTSLLRDVSISTIEGQYSRVLSGGVPLTNFNFTFKHPQEENFAEIDLRFDVEASSKPSTNIHAIIGRNGAGKTTLLNRMIEAITNPNESKGNFYRQNTILGPQSIGPNYFSNLVSISFSAFDPFSPPVEQNDPEIGTCYYYIGLKDCSDESGTLLKPLSDLHEEFIKGLSECFISTGKRERWLAAISTLESDENFAEMRLSELSNFSRRQLKEKARFLVRSMSSGHAIVLLTITKLVAKVEEKTLVLLDEPESHLHPPLLSALTRALSELLFNRNGVAIIATHSPVVLQELPKSCVWKITRSRLSLSSQRPEIETFGENVGTLTREVFGLEVVKSGYHTVLAKEVQRGLTYDEIVTNFGERLGFEAKAILRAMVTERDARDLDA